MQVDIQLLTRDNVMQLVALAVVLREGKLSMAKFDKVVECPGAAARATHEIDKAVAELMTHINAEFN